MARIIHRVEMGDTLQSISQKYYGNEARHTQIFEDNRSRLGCPENLQPGEHIVIR